jgi:hypothetical protein
MPSRRTARFALGGVIAWTAACGNAGVRPPPSAPVAASSASAGAPQEEREPPDGAVPKLSTGAILPVEDPTVRELRAVKRYVGEGYETLGVEVPEGISMPLAASMDAAPGQVASVAFVQPAPTGKSRTLWIRRAAVPPAAPITGDLFSNAEKGDSRHGRHYHFRIADPRALANEPSVRVEWLRALAQDLSHGYGREATAWSVFAASRVREIADRFDPATRKGKPAPASHTVRAPAPSSDLAELMETTTGATAVQEALQQNRPLFLRAAGEKATVPIALLKPPSLSPHPWNAMLARVGKPPGEPLASSAPADFYYLRAADLSSLFRLLDQVDAWATPAANLFDGVVEDRSLASRYELELALRRGPLTRVLGPAVVGEVALVGSDPYVREGSDVTVVLRVTNRPLFDAALAAAQVELGKDHGTLSHVTREHGGVTVRMARSTDGAVIQQRASVAGDLELVSNSAASIDAVLDTCQGRHAKLADEPDFQFMLARDATTRADVLAYMGDRFVGEVVGPRQKVLEARRQIALGELMTPGFAALLYGRMQGTSPAKVEDLFATSLLRKEELTHKSGAPIAWQPGAAARSSWGTPAALTPLIDLPAPDRVSTSERAGYERFAHAYQERWSAYIDPVAVRIAFDARDKGQTMTVDLRELPLIDGTDYRDVADFVGNARFAVRGLGSGIRAIAGIGRDAELRQGLERSIRTFSGHDLKLDWVGEWASIGLADRSEVASALLRLAGDELPQRPQESDDSHGLDVAAIATLPLYAEIAVKSTAQAALALAALRVVAGETIPGMFEWGEVARHRDVSLVRIALKKELASGFADVGSDVSIFYAVSGGAIILTLQDWLLRRLIDEQLGGRGPTAGGANGLQTAQLSFEVDSAPGKGLWTALGWLLEKQVVDASARSANAAAALLRGAPEIAADAAAIRRLALAYFGAEPLTPDGAPYGLAKEGVRDAVRGTDHAPVWPDVPVAGSPVAKVIESLAGVRTEISFDDEGKDGDKPMRSLHARAVFDVR